MKEIASPFGLAMTGGMTRRIFAVLILLSTLVLTGQGCRGRAEQAAEEPVTLTLWGVFDTDRPYRDIMGAYQAIHPNVSFDYRQLRVDEYENALLKAFAEGTGPDIFAVHNTWVGEYQNLIAPMPASLTIPYVEIRGTIKKERVVTVKEEPTITLRQLRNEFLDVVSDDVVRPYQISQRDEPQNRIFGLPLSVDSLALFYNKDLLNAAGIAGPALDWTQFHEHVTKLTRVGANDLIIQSGAALGGSRNVERAFDILSLLMMQNGTAMTDDRGSATFADANAAREVPGAQAATFYTDFANPLKNVYTWNNKQPNSFEAFVNGKAAYFFGYSYHLPLIRARAPKLKFDVASVPQVKDGRVVNYANYWVESVSKASKNQNWAWDFIQFMAKPDQVKNYLAAARKPPARRSLISSQLEDDDLSVFANQLLTSKSWYRGKNAAVAEQAFLELIDAVIGGTPAEDAIGSAQNKVNQSL
jgi:ABC-type glycerol-3-phosphate transport system substrate-binding protein